jgi:hypothetical protein
MTRSCLSPSIRLPSLVTLLLLGHSLRLQAEIRLPGIISDHMVLMRSAAVPIWGHADAGEPVSVSLAGTAAHTVAGADGKWKVVLDLTKAGPGPYELAVAGKNQIRVSDVLTGTVWLASGVPIFRSTSASFPAQG